MNTFNVLTNKSTMRRGNSTVVFVCIGAILLVGYGCYKVNELNLKLASQQKDISIKEYHERSLKDQLKVVFQHRDKIELAFKNERKENEELRTLLGKHLQECQRNISQSKHEATNRFNALDTQFKMLKASNEELNQNYMALQQNHVRLKSDLTTLDVQSHAEYKTLKEAKEAESISLQARVQDLFNDKVSLQNEVIKYEENEKINKAKLQEILAAAEEYEKKIKLYAKQTEKAIADLQNCRRGQAASNRGDEKKSIVNHVELQETHSEISEIDENSRMTRSALLNSDNTKTKKQSETSTVDKENQVKNLNLIADIDQNHESDPVKRVLAGVTDRLNNNDNKDNRFVVKNEPSIVAVAEKSANKIKNQDAGNVPDKYLPGENNFTKTFENSNENIDGDDLNKKGNIHQKNIIGSLLIDQNVSVVQNLGIVNDGYQKNNEVKPIQANKIKVNPHKVNLTQHQLKAPDLLQNQNHVQSRNQVPLPKPVQKINENAETEEVIRPDHEGALNIQPRNQLPFSELI